VGRVLRALEVYRLTGYTMSYQIEQSTKTPSRYAPLYIGLNAEDRDYLYSRIDLRVDQMAENGLLEEAKEALETEPGETAAQAIGIKEVIPYLKGERTLDECLDQLKLDTRHYAKRQITWFKKEPDIHWLSIDTYDSTDALYEEAYRLVEEAHIFD